MRVLIASTAGWGHRLPLAPFAEGLTAAGHEARTLISDPPRGRHWDGFKDLSRAEQSRWGAKEWFGRICVDHFRPRFEDACDEFRPDLILREPCEYASAIAAEARGIVHLTVAISAAEAEWSCIALVEGVLDDAVVDALRTAPYLTRFPASLDPSPFPDTRRYAEPAPPERTGELVYATFGTVAAQLGYDPYRALLDAVDGLDVPVLLTTGGASDLGPTPPNVTVERWVPQIEALARARLVVCHGGSGTVLGALAAGVPLVIMPLFVDQLTNAERLAAAGAARAVTPERLRDAILDPPPPPLAIAAEMRAAPPPLDALAK
jgi:UDP:flavonoid glycosyltransferase YjiC (YdhE family)